MRYKKSGVSGIDSPTMLSPSRFPATSGKRSVTEIKIQKNETRAFENENIIRGQDVGKGPPLLTKFKKYPARAISENIDRFLVKLGRLALEPTTIRARGEGEISIEVGVLRGGETFIWFLVMAEVPKNFMQVRSPAESL